MTVLCYVCGRRIGTYGWSQHVKKEKRLHGEDIYIKLKAQREGREYKSPPLQISTDQKSLLEYGFKRLIGD